VENGLKVMSHIRDLRDLKTGFRFGDQICWTSIQLVTAVHKSLTYCRLLRLDTLSPTELLDLLSPKTDSRYIA
jgi:hypothetical protein